MKLAPTCLAATLACLVGTAKARADRGDRWDPTTVGVQTLAGAGGMIGVGGLIMLVTYEKNCEGWDCYNFGPVLLAMIGGLAGNVVGIKLAGDALDGTGSVGGTLLGTGVGTVVGIGGLALSSKIGDKHPVIAFAMFALPIVAGGVIGYQLSADEKAGVSTRIPLFVRSF